MPNGTKVNFKASLIANDLRLTFSECGGLWVVVMFVV